MSFEDVVDWVEGRLDRERGDQVAAAVRADPALAAAAAWMHQFRDTTAGTVLMEPPPSVRDALRRRFAALRPAPPTPVERLRAALVYDSAALGLAGVRAASGMAGVRHLAL